MGLLKVMGELKLLKLIFQPKHQEELTLFLVKEGDFVKAGEVLATMDTRTLKEQLHEVQAQLEQGQK
ncbi:HlyD-family secretion protein [Proteus mirabilis]|uniref:HlyD-family secretion protein n=1 Tax=Proteus mirabilis TaxID=584 RepID=A0A379GID5_PROMI|nr:HlyD-family secretion protein [Proteus mirabilis]